jgi:hypothetical protein
MLNHILLLLKLSRKRNNKKEHTSNQNMENLLLKSHSDLLVKLFWIIFIARETKF